MVPFLNWQIKNFMIKLKRKMNKILKKHKNVLLKSVVNNRKEPYYDQ